MMMMNKATLFLALYAAASVTVTVNADEPEGPCPSDIQECPDGTTVIRQPPDCEFDPCPTSEPTPQPTDAETAEPTPQPTDAETAEPTPQPTDAETAEPTLAPTVTPTELPTEADVETDFPTFPPTTAAPTKAPSGVPSSSPTIRATTNSPSKAPSRNPSESPSGSPSVSPTISTAPSMVPTVEPTMNNGYLNCSEYNVELDVPGLAGATIEWVVNMYPLKDTNRTNLTMYLPEEYYGVIPNMELQMQMDEIMARAGHTAGGDDDDKEMELEDMMMMMDNETSPDYYPFGPPIISIRVTYDEEAWLAFAVSDAGKMIGSTAVIGSINATDGSTMVMQYNLTTDNAAPGYMMLPYQDLMDTAMTQDRSMTTLEFTRYLSDPTNEALTINGTGTNWFLVSHGQSNTLGYHGQQGRSAFEVSLTPCTPAYPTWDPPMVNMTNMTTGTMDGGDMGSDMDDTTMDDINMEFAPAEDFEAVTPAEDTRAADTDEKVPKEEEAAAAAEPVSGATAATKGFLGLVAAAVMGLFL